MVVPNDLAGARGHEHAADLAHERLDGDNDTDGLDATGSRGRGAAHGHAQDEAEEHRAARHAGELGARQGAKARARQGRHRVKDTLVQERAQIAKGVVLSKRHGKQREHHEAPDQDHARLDVAEKLAGALGRHAQVHGEAEGAGKHEADEHGIECRLMVVDGAHVHDGDAARGCGGNRQAESMVDCTQGLHPAQRQAHQAADERTQGDERPHEQDNEARRVGHAGHELVLVALGLKQHAGAGELGDGSERQGHDDDTLGADGEHDHAPDAKRVRQVRESLDKRHARARIARHGVKEGIEGRGVQALHHKRQRTDERGGDPRQARDDERLRARQSAGLGTHKAHGATEGKRRPEGEQEARSGSVLPCSKRHDERHEHGRADTAHQGAQRIHDGAHIIYAKSEPHVCRTPQRRRRYEPSL